MLQLLEAGFVSREKRLVKPFQLRLVRTFMGHGDFQESAAQGLSEGHV